MSSRYQPTISASVPPPSSIGGSSPIRGLSEALLNATASSVLARLEPPKALPADPSAVAAADFFAALSDEP